ncbi:villin-4 isoform X2 [Brachypodium distachyon]|uniref:villin-4 isoform X2 n=1 Tax=Brachypodium distachyon TaxID=15368 RepID=UPI00071D0BD9|nr:villin-4 isoform X2 [Brachypodium distachyon]|eukprot:XP_014750951.1 villin-4 isoform X2 [Brachypodium distachyon]
MSVSMKDLDPAFRGAGQKDGLEVWRIENFKPVPVPTSSYAKFYMGDSYIILKTSALKNGSFRHDIHYWLGKDTSQDEAGTAAILTVELDAALGGRAVQYREVQGNETEKLLSYFRPCIMPQPGGVASGFNHVEVNEQEHVTRLYVCRGKHVVHVKEVPFSRSSLNHEDIFILDTKSKIFQFNGSNSCIQERAKALEVVQYIKDTFHEGKCEVAAVEDGKLMADAEAGEFWAQFGGFAPLPRKTTSEETGKDSEIAVKLLCFNQGKLELITSEPLVHDLLETNKCYLLDCGAEMYVWLGRSTSLQVRKGASESAEKMLVADSRTQSHVMKVIEGYETVMFKSKFREWPPTPDLKLSSEDGRGKVAALLKSQGLDVKGLMKSAPVKEEPEPYIDCAGHLQVWRVSGNGKTLLSSSEQSKFYTGDCYIFQYTYAGDDKEECLIGTWFGNKSVEEERVSAISLASKMVQAAKFQAVMARLYEGKEPIQFFVIFQSLQVFKGGLSSGYKNFIAQNGLDDDSYSEAGLALFRIQGSGSENMQAIQVDAVASSLNSSYCYILHDGNSVFTWIGNGTTSLDHDLVERQLDAIKSDLPSRSQKEGRETDKFWELLGGKTKYSNKKIEREQESDPHLFSCILSKGNLKATEIHHFTQEDLMTEDVFVLDCHSYIFVWFGQEVDAKVRTQAMDIGEKFIVRDFLMENLSRETTIFTVSEGSEPQFFTRFFTWDSTKSLMHGSSYQRKLAILKGGATRLLDKPKRRTPAVSGRSVGQDKSQRSRSMSTSPECHRVRGRSPAFAALTSAFEKPSTRNLSTPPPAVKKLFPKSAGPEVSKQSAISDLTSAFEGPLKRTIPKSVKAGQEAEKSIQEEDATGGDDGNEVEDDEGRTIYPYERLVTNAEDPAPDIDLTKREAYLSATEFSEKFSMTRAEFNKIPKWKQNKLKTALQLF